MRPSRIIQLFLVVVLLAIFSPVRNHEFVWDDRSNITENPYLRKVTLSKVLSFWQTPYQQLYIPLTYTVWAGIAGWAENPAADARHRLDARPFHWVNLTLHTLSVLTVFVILRRLTGHEWAAGAGALLFGLHPLQVEAVSWVTGMKDLLCGLLSLVALWQYLVYARPVGAERQNSGWGLHYGIATCAFVLALLAKPSAVALPALAWALDYGILKRSLRQSAHSLGGWVVLALVFVGITKWVQPASHVGLMSPLWLRPLVAMDALAFYLYKLILPIQLSVDYGRTPTVVMGQGWGYYTWIVPVGLAALLWAWRDRARFLLVAAAVFVGGLLPVLGLVPFGFQQISTVADRYVYLSMLGPALALAWALSKWRNPVAPVMAGMLLVALGIGGMFQAQIWKNNQSLFQHALELNPHSWMAQLNLGFDLAKQGKLDEAMARYRAALQIRPGFAHALTDLGAALAVQGRFAEAIEQYRQALLSDPEAPDIHFNLASALAKLNQLDEAVEHFRKSLAAEPDNASTHSSLGQALFKQGKAEEAVAHYRKALEIDPEDAEVHYRLANVLDRRGEFDEAMRHYLQAVAGNPAYAGAYLNVGVILANRGQWDAAIEYFHQALRVRPEFPEARENLARALALRGETDEATRP